MKFVTYKIDKNRGLLRRFYVNYGIRFEKSDRYGQTLKITLYTLLNTVETM